MVFFFIFAQAISWILFKQAPTASIVVGGALIFAGGLVLADSSLASAKFALSGHEFAARFRPLSVLQFRLGKMWIYMSPLASGSTNNIDHLIPIYRYQGMLMTTIRWLPRTSRRSLSSCAR